MKKAHYLALNFKSTKPLGKAAKDLDFMQAAKLRDEIKKLQEQLA